MTQKEAMVFEKLVSFVFPIKCMHCEGVVEQMGLCDPCARQLLVLDSTACSSCGAWTEDGGRCAQCHKEPSALHQVSSVFPYQGIAGHLVRKLKYGNQRYLAKGIASFMVAHWIELGWRAPDVVTFVPMNWVRSLGRGYNHSQLLAKEFASMNGLSLCSSLKKRMGQTPQAGLGYEQRRGFGKEEYWVHAPYAVEGKSILLIDDVSTTGSTIKHCAARLHESGASEIRALTFCRACDL